MEKEDIEYFNEILSGQLATLVEQFEGTPPSALDQEGGNTGPSIRIAPGSESRFVQRIKEREARLIRKIEDALQRIEDGTFGICETCGGDIPLERLRARPVSTQCVDCATPDDVA